MKTSIKTDQPSSGKSVIISKVINNIGDTEGDWVQLIETNNFSVPIRNEDAAVIDPNNAGCELVEGELFMSAPLFVCNNGSIPAKVQIRVSNELGFKFYLTPEMTIPIDESIQIPIQGQVLLKSNDVSKIIQNITTLEFESPGDSLEIRVSVGTAGSIYVYGNATESEASVHASYTEAK